MTPTPSQEADRAEFEAAAEMLEGVVCFGEMRPAIDTAIKCLRAARPASTNSATTGASGVSGASDLSAAAEPATVRVKTSVSTEGATWSLSIGKVTLTPVAAAKPTGRQYPALHTAFRHAWQGNKTAAAAYAEHAATQMEGAGDGQQAKYLRGTLAVLKGERAAVCIRPAMTGPAAPSPSTLREWADEPAAANGMVPVHPTTLRAIADALDASLPASREREPLTDAEIEDCIDSANLKFNMRRMGARGQQITTYDDWKYWLAREIEAAHIGWPAAPEAGIRSTAAADGAKT